MVMVAERSEDWRFVRFNDAGWGPRAGYVHCSQLRALTTQSRVEQQSAHQAQPQQPNPRAPKTIESESTRPRVAVAVVRGGRVETVTGYAEWIRDGYLIAGGQRITWDNSTRVRAGGVQSPREIPVGSEIVAKGLRTTDGALLAREIEAKANGIALYENEVLQQSDAVETIWVREGLMFLGDGRTRRDFGRVLEAGDGVDRSRRIMARLVPSYIDAGRIRVRVVDDSQWNARAMANGAIWVHRGLLEDASDDEMAIVLGHELAHYTHEHIRKSARNDMWRQLAALGAAAVVEAMDSPAGRQAVVAAARLSLLAWGSGYNRNLEDEADRVGLRYAYESGFDVTRGVDLWRRARSRSGEMDPITNWIAGSHSRPTDRIKNIERELVLNYQQRALR
jgi:Zn-dependent protease with chaperone function